MTTPDQPANASSCTRRRQRTPARRHSLDSYPQLMTVAEAASYLRIAPSTAYLLANLHLNGHPQAHMPALRVGGRIRILRSALASALDADT